MSSDSTELDSLSVKWRKSYYIIEFLINQVYYSPNGIKKGSYLG